MDNPLADQISYVQFNLFSGIGVQHAIFTRKGGVSPDPWSSLNLGGLSGDRKENVVENRKRIFAAINRPVETVFDSWLIHGTAYIRADKPRPLDEPHRKADIVMTNQADVTLLMRFADCVPIMLVDPIRKAVCIVHAGWRGALGRVAQVATRAMTKEYGSDPRDLIAGIGPSICSKCYEIREDVAESVKQGFGDGTPYLHHNQVGMSLDLWGICKHTLLDAGLEGENIEVSGICTAENTRDWYSHRAEKGKTGRFAALLGLDMQ